MNREIKFRAWDKQAKHMAYQGDPDIETTLSFFFHYGVELLLQFTGFKDKNDTEIYDGDIIGDWCEVDGKQEQSKLTVYFDTTLGQWMLDCSSKQDKSISYSLFKELQDFQYEVIGNIYQHPHLLNTND